MDKNQKKFLLTGSFLLASGVALSAFGAHGLKEMVDAKHLAAFKTGTEYQVMHGLGFLVLATLSALFRDIQFKNMSRFLLVGVILFCVNLYLYALTDIKIFAMIVPLGGLSFILGWGLLFVEVLRMKVKVTD